MLLGTSGRQTTELAAPDRATRFSRELVEKEINGGNPAVPGNDEISPGVSWRLTRPALYPLDPPAITHFLWPCNWLIPKVRVSSPELARDAIDLLATTVNAPAGFVEHAISVKICQCTRRLLRVVFTEDVVEITDQQVDMLLDIACLLSASSAPGDFQLARQQLS
jgi:hypothetical protein